MKWAKRNNIEAWRIYDRDIPQFPLCRRCLRRPNPSSGIRYRLADAARRIRSMACRCIGSYWFCDGFAPEQIHLKRRRNVKKVCSNTRKPAKPATISSSPKTAASFGSTLTNTSTPAFSSTTATRAKKVGETAAGKTFPQPVFLYRQLHRLCRNRRRGIQRNCRFIQHLSRVGKTHFELNGIDTEQHKIVRADVFQYLQNAADEGKKFDLIAWIRPAFQQQKDARHPRHPARP